MRIFGKEKIKKLVKISNTQVQLPSGSLVHLGGSAHKLGNLVLDTSIIGAGGIESTTSNNVMYHVYAVLDAGIVKLIASASRIRPSNFKSYKKVGAFLTDMSGNVFHAYKFGDSVDFDAISFNPTFSLSTNASANGSFSRIGGKAFISINIKYLGSTNVATGFLNNPNSLLTDVTRMSIGLSGLTPVGFGELSDSSSSSSHSLVLVVQLSNNTRVLMRSTNGVTSQANVSDAIPFSIESNDSVGANWSIPILGWSKNDLDWNNY